jgi:hypothetical protein
MYNQSKSYFDIKTDQLNAISTIKVVGIPIQTADKPQGNNLQRHIAIEHGCLCVIDSPDDPCPCRHLPPIIIWLPEDGCIHKYKSDTPNHDGRELTVFEMDRSVTIFIEKMQAIDLSKVSNNNTFKMNGIGSKPPIKIPTLANALIPIWWHLVEALEVGYTIGEHIDEATGLSDWLAGVDNSPHKVPVK